MITLEAALLAVVAGDLDAFPILLSAGPAELQGAARNLNSLSISRAALMSVLQDWRSGGHSAADVQQWASFVRRGYIAGKALRGAHPLNIKYDADDEDLIVEIIGRFDEIGDLIDGRIDENEQVEMLRLLEG